MSLIQTPSFGVCLGRCVLSTDACTSDKYVGASQIYNAPYETDEACTDPEQVYIGRCQSTLDAKHCGASSASCGADSSFFDVLDDSCSLVDDKDTLVRTNFPACSNLDDDTWQCVLGLEDECLDGERFVYSKWASDWGPSPCYCEDVPTGICYHRILDEGFSEITTENSFCAVSERDCPSDYLWMTARDFQENPFTTYDCRLCESNSSGTTTTTTTTTDTTTVTTPTTTTTTTTTVSAMATFIVEAGACLNPQASHTEFDSDQVDSCALEALNCPMNYQFVSSETLKEQGLDCPLEQTTNWGTCSTDEEPTECTNKVTSCLHDFRPENVEKCDIYGNSQTGLPTYFPNCYPISQNDQEKREARCVWSEFECDIDTEWFSKVNLSASHKCTCEDVLTGVCKEPSTGEYHCAVSPRACTDPTSYVLQSDLEAEGIYMKCQLCPPKMPSSNSSPVPPPVLSPVATPSPPPIPVPETTAPVPPPIAFLTETRFPTLNPILIARPTFPPIPRPTNRPTTLAPTRYPTQPIGPITANSNKDDLSTGALAGLATAGALVCALIVLIVTLLSRNDEREPVVDPDAYDDSDEPFGDMPDEIVIDDSEPVSSSGTMT